VGVSVALAERFDRTAEGLVRSLWSGVVSLLSPGYTAVMEERDGGCYGRGRHRRGVVFFRPLAVFGTGATSAVLGIDYAPLSHRDYLDALLEHLTWSYTLDVDRRQPFARARLPGGGFQLTAYGLVFEHGHSVLAFLARSLYHCALPHSDTRTESERPVRVSLGVFDKAARVSSHVLDKDLSPRRIPASGIRFRASIA